MVETAMVKLIETDDIFCIVERLKQRLDCYNSGTLNTLRRSASLGFFFTFAERLEAPPS